jgi:hypothetical protein
MPKRTRKKEKYDTQEINNLSPGRGARIFKLNRGPYLVYKHVPFLVYSDILFYIKSLVVVFG